MDNNQESRIGCHGNNRLKIIDPNSFNGSSSSSNSPVQNEDLNISVKLSTRRKGRTVLTTDTNKKGTVENVSTVKINFIEGSEINNSGKKVLTTKYTDLTTVFEEGTINSETLGITNIDIDFNSSMAPMITIDFIDVRGSSIFQNEGDISNKNSSNPYSTFFSFPYPLFELEIKGYYGKPVTYCLHMVKFNARFNSQTGNFEIKCNFIGYTYAMLSDMLVGLLKVIPFTKIGGAKFEAYKSGRVEPLFNLVELKKKIGDINESIKKLSVTSDNSKTINSFSTANQFLGNIENTLNSLGQFDNFQRKSIINKFVIMDDVDLDGEKLTRFSQINNDLKDYIKKYNDLGIQGLLLNESDFLPIVSYPGLTVKFVEPDSVYSIGNVKGPDLNNLKQDLTTDIKTSYNITFADNKYFRIYDLRSRFDLISKQQEIVIKSIDNSSRALAVEFKDNVSKTLGFDPTVRSIIEIFTALIEVYMETIYDVSKEAEGDVKRKEQLKKVFDKDITTDISHDNLTSNNYYPWPDYREYDTNKKTYVEKYLGSCSRINPKSDVTELRFIDELYNAFILAKIEEEKNDSLNSLGATNWIASNPLDTRLFQTNGKSPYTRTNMINPNDVARLMLIRGMTFLGYTNDVQYLKSGEGQDIQNMAKLEAKAILANIKEPKIGLGSITLDTIKNAHGNISGSDRNVIKFDENNKVYYYDYVVSDNTVNSVKVIPLTTDFNNESVRYNNSLDVVELDSGNENTYYLTNYSPGYLETSTIPFYKNDDGGTYVKFFTPSQYATTSTLSDTTIKTDNKIILEKLADNKINEAGFNVFGSNYGIQEFSTMDYGSNGPEDLPLMYVFYDDVTANTSGEFNKFGLANTRKASIEKQNLTKNSVLQSIYDFDETKSSLNIIFNDGDYKDFFKSLGNNDLHSNLGKNRFLAKEFKDSPDSVTYPYIEQPLFNNNGYSFSLFGSKWYYLQDKSVCKDVNGVAIYNSGNYTKALIYLNTLPFKSSLSKGPFGPNTIKRLFDVRGGFVHTPRLWCAYIGALLWWMSDDQPVIINGKIVGGGRGSADPVIWQKSCTGDWEQNVASMFKIPNVNNYFPKFLDFVSNSDSNPSVNGYDIISENEILRTLPNQVKDSFKKVFFDFVNGTDENYISFDDLRKDLEITTQNSTNFCAFINKVSKKTPNGFLGYTPVNNQYYLSNTQIKANLINYDNYKIISNFVRYNRSDSLFLELKDGSKAVNKILTALNEEIIIANTGYAIWRGPKDGDFGINGNQITTKYKGITVPKDKFEEYFNTLTKELKASTSGYTVNSEEQKITNELFGTSNKDDIKLMLYRNCKNIYDKWLGGITDGQNLIFQCGDDENVNSNRNTTDTAMGKKYGYDKPKLIHSFRFVNRSFRDIGDELFIDPTPINEKIAGMPNTSAYDLISSLLNDNKFEFIALPTFINFHDDKELESMFKPFDVYEEVVSSCGPSFVAVYTGQKSKNLDLSNSDYSNDGFDLRCVNGILDKSIPDDLLEPLGNTDKNGNDVGIYEDSLPVFTVKYGQQNQNIFKDVNLDQSEFTESEESLKIMQDISTKGAETARTIGGQNMYNIYSVRSYTAQIEMLGNAMIQPMMYFQLDNIPMFHGAYMITRVKHNIKPNHMSTNFTGVRIRAAETPIIDIADAYMELIKTLDLSLAGKSKNAVAYRGNSSFSTKPPRKDIGCNIVKKTTLDFTEIVKLIIVNLEGRYCSGGYKCGDIKTKPPRSGETLWGLDRKNHSGSLDNVFWELVDDNINKPQKWGQDFPSPNDVDNSLFSTYISIIKNDYDNFKKRYIHNEELKNLIESDGRLYLNMVYATYNGAGWFKGFAKILESNYNGGVKTADELLKIFVDERVSGGFNAYPAGSELIANTGVNIQKMVGLSSIC